MYISGYGGTGKFYLTKAIKGFLDIQRKSHDRKCDYVVAAPTGLAAAGIGGQTIHSIFNIGIQHGKIHVSQRKCFRPNEGSHGKSKLHNFIYI